MAKLDKAPNNFRGVHSVDIEAHAICKAWLTPTLEPIPPTRSPTRPTRLLREGFDYVPAARTDITQTWRRFGWSPKEKPQCP